MSVPYDAAVAVAIALAASVTDLRSRRIPNVLTFGAAGFALAFHLITGGPAGLLWGLAGWAVGLLLMFVPFALGGLGGGDVKLLAAIGAWLGPTAAVWVALYTGAVGGVAALAVALVRGYLKKALSNLWLLLMHWCVSGIRPLDEVTLAESDSPRLAYAVPILAGTLLTVWLHS